MAGKYIEAGALIAEASSTIKNVTQQEQQLMLQWCYTALRNIGFGRLDIRKSDHLTLDDFSAAKPDDLGLLIDLALFDSTGAEIVIKYKGQVNGTNDQEFGRVHQDVRPIVQALQVTEDDDYFNVQEFADTSPDDAYLVARYYAYPVDSKGMPKIPEGHTIAIMMYIRWMWSMRENNSLSAQQAAREVWLREKASAYSKMKTPTELENKEFARTINSMIQKPVIRHRQF